MRPEHVYPGLAAQFVRSLLPPDLNRNADFVRAREIGMVVKVCTPFTVRPPHEQWWVRREDGRMTVCDVSELEVASRQTEAVMEALNMLQRPFQVEPPEEMAPRLKLLPRNHQDTWRDGWQQAMKFVSQRARELIWDIDPW